MMLIAIEGQADATRLIILSDDIPLSPYDGFVKISWESSNRT
jgi:hypothetical protein